MEVHVLPAGLGMGAAVPATWAVIAIAPRAGPETAVGPIALLPPPAVQIAVVEMAAIPIAAGQTPGAQVASAEAAMATAALKPAVTEHGTVAKGTAQQLTTLPVGVVPIAFGKGLFVDVTRPFGFLEGTAQPLAMLDPWAFELTSREQTVFGLPLFEAIGFDPHGGPLTVAQFEAADRARTPVATCDQAVTQIAVGNVGLKPFTVDELAVREDGL